MSGIDKKVSALLRLGDASKCILKTGANKIVKEQKGARWSTKWTSKGNGWQRTFVQNIKIGTIKRKEKSVD